MYSLYLHIPFCRHRCGYCDFNTYASLETLIPDYVEALCVEVRSLAQAASDPLPVHTVFFGGGTPSLLPVNAVRQILNTIEQFFALTSETEVSLEANPETLSQNYLSGLREAGVNRLSLGVQSAHPGELRLLERTHDYPDVIQSVLWARRAGFDNLNLDLIYGLPEQKRATWQTTLELALGLQPEHLSLYALSLEHGTPFSHWAAHGLLSSPDPDLAADMYDYATDRLEAAGCIQYEISNWARALPADQNQTSQSPALACRHNLQYWRNLPYLGFGAAGAHGYAHQYRTANLLSPAAYIKALRMDAPKRPPFPRSPATQNLVQIDLSAEIAETLMMRLRLTREGVSEKQFEQRFELSLEDKFARQIEQLINLGLLEWIQDPQSRHLRLTRAGRLLGNQVFREFI
ncbi:MAG: hypothetical protein B6D39_02770 [Anaerolineae bacterium UTCFX2]|jgi:oxygen-independent coproporphyrinogen-3 oxidase|nr:MAG: hypothetical protein B6D39_02770 [Anaerolineae bacterium UTCFX2]